MATTYNRIQFESGPWGKTRGFQKLEDGAEVGLFDPEGSPLRLSGVQYSYKVIQEKVTPPFVAASAPSPEVRPPASVPPPFEPDEIKPPAKKKRAAAIHKPGNAHKQVKKPPVKKKRRR
jgi:hypothetical protein